MMRLNADTFCQRPRTLFVCFFWSIMALTHFFTSASAIATTVYMDGATDQFRGIDFTVNITVDAVTDVYGTAFDVTYDPAFLDLVDSDIVTPDLQPDVVEGSLLNNDGADTSYMRFALEDGKPGNLILGITRSGDVSGVDAFSEAIIASLRFFPKKLGTTSIMFKKQDLKDSGNVSIMVDSWNPLTIDIRLPPFGDFDHNGLIDMRDLILGLRALSSALSVDVYFDVDADGDGKLSMGDVVYVIKVLAEL